MVGNREKIAWIEKAHIKRRHSAFRVGDTVRVFVKILEEDKTRLQSFEGVVIARKGSGLGETFTVRRVAFGEGMERTFLLESPFIEKLQVVRGGKVRRAKLYYLRKKMGKGSRIETRWGEAAATVGTASEVRPEIQAPGVPAAGGGG